MCYFITVGVPESNSNALDKHVPRGMHIARVENPSLLSQMGDGFATYLLMSGGCSCDLFGESHHDPAERCEEQEHMAQERRRRKYEKRGWSKAKIERAIGQARGDPEAEPLVGLRRDVQRLLGEVAINAGEVAVVIHWYEQDVEESQFTCTQGPVVPAQDALEGRLQLECDEILRITSPR